MNEKLENVLQLALETPENIREETEDLNVGFDSSEGTWELIVKYHGSLDGISAMGIQVEELLAGYAILTVPQGLVEQVAAIEQIEYVEKPKRYYYSQVGRAGMPSDGSCLSLVTRREPFLSGEGVLIAVLDSGIRWDNEVFCRPDGTTRIRFLWDQTLGREFDAQQINGALQETDLQKRYELLPSIDVSGHGTAVAGIAAGYARAASGAEVYSGAAPRAELIIVKLGTPDATGFPRTTQIMRGVDYALRKAQQLQMPLVVNLSFGNSYGAHDGSSLLERFLDNAAEVGRTVVCVGSGNDGNSGGHVAGNVADSRAVELAVAEYERNLNFQLWKNYSDEYRVRLRSPGGQEAELNPAVESGKYTLQLEQTSLLVYLGVPAPYSVVQEIYVEMLPAYGPYINSGVWTILVEPLKTVTGQYYFYLPSAAARNARTQFYRSTPQVTLTIPSTAAKVITVGAYNSSFDAYADFSGRGYETLARTVGVTAAGLVKPDLVAPGVDVLAPDVYGGYVSVTGTSFAVPIVSGSAALLMEWGIVRGNDPFLYGEKVKAYLRKGARALRGESELPNARVGWGALCVADSLPNSL